jgi:hypothetical protein
MSPRSAALALLTLCLGLRCDASAPARSSTPTGPVALATTAEKAAASSPPRPPLEARARAALAEVPGCRVMTASGRVELGAESVRPGDKLHDGRSLTLAADATLHLVHTVSARSWTITGPARLVACENGSEEIVLARGTLRAEPSAGVRPGAEVWVGTPYGSFRYADAGAELELGARELRVRIASGQVWFSALTAEPAAERLLAGSTTLGAGAQRLSSAQATARCGRDATLAETRATELLAVSAQPLGARAAEHVRARQRAHASCTSARAAVLAELDADRGAASEPRGAERAGDSELARFDQLWRRVPAPPRVVPAP